MNMEVEVSEINNKFQPIPPQEHNNCATEMVEEKSVEGKKVLHPPGNSLPTFGSGPNTNKIYTVEDEIVWLPFHSIWVMLH